MHVAINCHALTPPFTGVQRAISGLVAGLTEFAPAEFSFSAYVPWGFEDSLLPQTENLQLLRSWARTGNRTLRILWEQFVLQGRVFKDQVDLLHAPCYVMPVLTLKPTVVNIHDVFAFTHPQFCTSSNRLHFRRLMPKTVKRAKAIIVPTNAVKRSVVDTFTNIASDKVKVIPWGVSDIFLPVNDKKKRQAVALRYGLPPRYLLHVARHEPKKNIVQTIEAFFAACMSCKLPHHLVLAGPEGWGLKQLDKVIRELGFEERVLRLGFVPDKDMPTIYSMAEALVHSSLAEGFGFPVLEAMACDTPVIASNIPCLSEVCAAGAHLVEAGSLSALRIGLEKVLAEKNYREELRERGREQVKKFTWEQHVGTTLELYKQVLAES